MRLKEFQQMRPRHQYQEVCRSGHYLHYIQPPDYFFDLLLYDLDGFFVELWQHRQTGNVFRIRAFRDGPELAPHLRCIHLPADLGVPFSSSNPHSTGDEHA
jgi:hypothetical protein